MTLTTPNMTANLTKARDKGRRTPATIRRGTLVGIAVALGSLALAACGDDDSTGSLSAELDSVRSTTAEFSDVNVAIAAGYAPTPSCVENPDAGAMGIHYIKGALVGDPAVNAEQPEALLYLPDGDDLVLVGVEWIALDADGDAATADDRPTLFGNAFDGPHPGHGPDEPVHYDLHAWVHEENPAGAFAPFNSSLACPSQ